MKNIKIRFVGRCKSINSEPTDYMVQEKKWFGWEYIYYSEYAYGECVITLYCNKDKQTSYQNILDNYYKVGEKFVVTEEYPMIIRY